MAGSWALAPIITALLWNYLHLSPWIGIPLAMLAAVVAAVLIGYPRFRFRITGHYFALLTLALSAIVLQVITATRDITGGSLGYTPERYKWGHLARHGERHWGIVTDGVRRRGWWTLRAIGADRRCGDHNHVDRDIAHLVRHNGR